MAIQGFGLNGTKYYTNICKPIDINFNFIVDPTNGNGLGIRSLKSNGAVKNVFMNTQIVPAGSPALGIARTYAAIGATTVTNTGNSVLTGNLGLYPGTSITGFPPGTFSGAENIANTSSMNARAAAQAAYTEMQARTPTGISSVLGGQSLAAGVYVATSGTAGTFALNGTLTLTGSATDIYVFQTATTLITGASGTPVITLGNVLPQNVYWVVGSSATLSSSNAGTFYGNVIALTSITCTLASDVQGSLIALNGAVTFSAATTVEAQLLSESSIALAAGNPNPAPGYALIQFNNNFNHYLGGFSGFASYISGSNIAINGTSLVLGMPYVITSLGTSTLADWQRCGLPVGFTPAVGQSFIAINTGDGAGTGTGQVQLPVVSGCNSMEVIGNTNLLISNSNVSKNGGALLLVQFLSNNIPTAPLPNTTVGMCARFNDSSVTVDGL